MHGENQNAQKAFVENLEVKRTWEI